MNFVGDENFLLYAAKHYDNPSCSTQSEFEDDVSKIRSIVKMLRKYSRSGEINERLVVNHLILLYNVFEREAATRMLCLKCRDLMMYLKPFLVLLNYWPERIEHVGEYGRVIYGSDVPMDYLLVEKLRRI